MTSRARSGLSGLRERGTSSAKETRDETCRNSDLRRVRSGPGGRAARGRGGACRGDRKGRRQRGVVLARKASGGGGWTGPAGEAAGGSSGAGRGRWGAGSAGVRGRA